MFSRPQIDTLIQRADGYTAKAAALPALDDRRYAFIILALADYHEALSHTLRFQLETLHDETARELCALTLALRESIFFVGEYAFSRRQPTYQLEPRDTLENAKPMPRVQPAYA